MLPERLSWRSESASPVLHSAVVWASVSLPAQSRRAELTVWFSALHRVGRGPRSQGSPHRVFQYVPQSTPAASFLAPVLDRYREGDRGGKKVEERGGRLRSDFLLCNLLLVTALLWALA